MGDVGDEFLPHPHEPGHFADVVEDRHGEHIMDGFAGPDELHAQDHVRAGLHFQRDEPGLVLRRGKQFVERLLDFRRRDDFHGEFAFRVLGLREQAHEGGVDQPDAPFFADDEHSLVHHVEDGFELRLVLGDGAQVFLGTVGHVVDGMGQPPEFPAGQDMETAAVALSGGVRGDAFHDPDHLLERAFQMRREPVGEEQGDQRRQPDDGEPLPFGLGDAFLYVLERHGDPDEAVRKLSDGGEGDGRIDQIRIQRIAVADADPEPLPDGGSDFLAIRVVVEVVQVDPAGVGFREHGPVRTDEGDADAELRADPVEGGGEPMHAVRGRLHLHTDEHGFAPGIADGLLNAVFLDVFADVQPREHQRHHNDGHEAEEEACSELGVAHVTPCSGSLRRALFR